VAGLLPPPQRDIPGGACPIGTLLAALLLTHTGPLPATGEPAI